MIIKNISDFIVPTRARSSSSFFNRLFTETSDCIAGLWTSITDLSIQQRRQSTAISVNDIAFSNVIAELSGSFTTAVNNISGRATFWAPGDLGCDLDANTEISNGYLRLKRSGLSHISTAEDEFGITKASENITVYVNNLELRDSSIYRVLNGSRGYYWYAEPSNDDTYIVTINTNLQGGTKRLEYITLETVPTFGATVEGIYAGGTKKTNRFVTTGEHSFRFTQSTYDGNLSIWLKPYNYAPGSYIVGLRYLDFGEFSSTQNVGTATITFTIPENASLSSFRIYDDVGLVTYDISKMAQITIRDTTGIIYDSTVNRWPFTRATSDLDIPCTGTTLTVSINFLQNSPLQIREITLTYA